MAKYYCKGCDSIIERDCNTKTMKSMCETVGNKMITLKLVTPEEEALFKEIKKNAPRN